MRPFLVRSEPVDSQSAQVEERGRFTVEAKVVHYQGGRAGKVSIWTRPKGENLPNWYD